MALFGFGKKDYASIYRNYYKQAMAIIKSTNWRDSEIAKSDLGPIMYVVGDFAAFNAGKDRTAVINAIFSEWMNAEGRSGNPEAMKKQFYERVYFYAPFMRDKTATMDFWQSNDKPDPNPILNITAAFSDVLYNPNRYDNYDDYAFIIPPFTAAMELSMQLFPPLFKEMVNYHNAIYK